MILTGKAKIDFEKWYWNGWFSDHEREFYTTEYEALKCLKQTDKVFLHPILISWLDSVGVIISIRWEWSTKTFQASIFIFDKNNTFDVFHLPHSKTRKDITEKAIIKANEIYNQRNTN